MPPSPLIMRARLFSVLLGIVLLGGCAKESSEPLKDITGRWDIESTHSTVYTDKGAIDYENHTLGTANDYYTFAADNTFTSTLNAWVSLAGTYSYSNTSLSITTAQGAHTEEITLFTPTHLTLVNGKKEAGRRSIVQVTTLVKH
ncbi:hypothetical protein GCM10027346_37810 [Hymenobacter seoulensis]